MSKLIYAEPDDEITNLVDRLRSEKTEKELVFVLPGGSRVLHSNLNARLLKQYSNSLGKSTSVISPDARTQAIAIETGFSVFPNLAAFESGKAIDRPVDAGAALTPGPATLGSLPVESGAFEDVPTTRRATPPPPVAPRTRPKPAAAAAEARGGRARYIPYVLGGVGVLLILLILFLFVLPSATVQIVIPARAISAQPTITGSTAAPGPNDIASVQTAVQQAQEQMQQANIPATGQKPIPAVAAAGNVVFTNHTTLGLMFPANTEVYTDGGQKFTTTQAVTVGTGGQSSPVPITARAGGVASNVPAHAITHITGAPSVLATADNTDATSGGVDATTKVVVAQTDQDKVKKALGDQLTAKVSADLAKSAGSQKLLADTLTISAVDASFDKKPGDEAANFNATATVKGSEVSLDDAKVKQVLTVALHKQAPAGYTLTDNPLKLDYKLAQHDDKGGVVLSGTASGFMATAINKDDIRSHITGQSIAKARAYIHGNIDSSNIIISESPSLIPWLPFIGSRIDLKTTVENPQPG
jgi:hypothetical protein